MHRMRTSFVARTLLPQQGQTYLRWWLFPLVVGAVPASPPAAFPLPAPRGGDAPFDAVHLYVLPALLQNELAKGVCRLGDAPPDARVITDVKITGRGCIAKFFVVIGPAAVGVLDALLHIPKMDTFMQHGGDHILDGSVQCPRADVKFMAGARSFVPRLGDGHMTISPRGALYGDDGFL